MPYRRSEATCLFQIAAVVCATFLLAWTPYATVSLMSALLLSGNHEAEAQHPDLAALNSHSAATILDGTWLLNWTDSNLYSKTQPGPENSWSEVKNMSSTLLNSKVQQMSQGLTVLSSFPPVVSLIPALFAKSHCMINPLIYHVMNREFRGKVHELVFGQETAERRQMKRREQSSFQRKQDELISQHDIYIYIYICNGFMKLRCFFFSFFASSRKCQCLLQPWMEGKEEQALIHV